MPTPEGIITTSTIWTEPQEKVIVEETIQEENKDDN